MWKPVLLAAGLAFALTGCIMGGDKPVVATEFYVNMVDGKCVIEKVAVEVKAGPFHDKAEAKSWKDGSTECPKSMDGNGTGGTADGK